MLKNTFLLIALCALLSACGQKGALYLPNTPSQTPTAPSTDGDVILDAPTTDTAQDY